MKIAILALVACAAGLAASESIKERDGYLYQHRKRLGHFKEQPFIDLYKTYATAFVLPLHSDRSHDDYRSYTPSADECVIYLQQFRTNKYKVDKIDEFILLDACLGYLYESEYKELDKSQSEMASQKLDILINDDELKAIYKSTINELNDGAKTCIANLLISSVFMRKQYIHERCNSHWIQLFLQFAGCHNSIPQELRQTDSYIKIIYQLVREETQFCFNAEKLALETAIREYYRRSYVTRFRNNVKSILGKSIEKQQGERMWPQPIVKLLKVVQDAHKEINLRQVHQLLRGYYLDDPDLKKIFFRNIAKYAQKVIDVKQKDKNGDPTGSGRYQDQVVNGLCNFFRSADNDKGYDFATSFVRLVRLLEHEDVFGISFEDFIKKVLTHSEESASMYLSISACNILTYTQGYIKLPIRGKRLEFVVEPKSKTDGMVRWPDAGYY